MILGLGMDLADLSRIESVLAQRGDAFLARIFTERERRLLERDAALVARVAARFAAKEAVFKALGTGWGQGVGWHDVEVLGGRGEPPRLELRGAAERRMRDLGARQADVTLTHTPDVAGATVILS